MGGFSALAASSVRTSWFRALGYSPGAMADEATVLDRDAALAQVRARILGLARARLSPADAEDLTQEALALLATKYAHITDAGELVAIGARIVAFKRTALWRKKARRQAKGETPVASLEGGDADPLENVEGEAPDPERVACARQRLSLLIEAAARLDGRCREILRRKLQGASFVEIAAELGRPVNTVYSWDYRCHRRLKALLGDRWGFVSGQEER
jgi:RNA polymerase sigma factor (sigma-70 family)